jgi:hypothetical protein
LRAAGNTAVTPERCQRGGDSRNTLRVRGYRNSVAAAARMAAATVETTAVTAIEPTGVAVVAARVAAGMVMMVVVMRATNSPGGGHIIGQSFESGTTFAPPHAACAQRSQHADNQDNRERNTEHRLHIPASR